MDLLGTHQKMLDSIQRETFDFFLKEVDPDTGLVADKTRRGFPSSIAVVGMALSAYIIGVEKEFISREQASRRIRKVLNFFWSSPQSEDPSASGYKGFYYHFLDMKTGKRALQSELSTIDTAILIMGMLSVARYFSEDTPQDQQIRQLAESIYQRVDWQWALNGGSTITHGWNPESGFLPYRWEDNYSEALMLYVLALGSPTYPTSQEGYRKWTASFKIKKVYDFQYLYAGPLFIHQFSHMWIDFRGIEDEFNKKAGFDYFENSRRATYVHRQYATENPEKFQGYGRFSWGLTASDGPGDHQLNINGEQRRFYGYLARGAPYGPDDGTLSPWAVVASLPFAPEIVLDTMVHAIEKLNLRRSNWYGFDASFNATYPERKDNPNGWVSPYRFGLNQGPIVIMIENYISGLIWKIMRGCPHIVAGLRKAGFSGGWLP
jgi:hypothetical protein